VSTLMGMGEHPGMSCIRTFNSHNTEDKQFRSDYYLSRVSFLFSLLSLFLCLELFCLLLSLILTSVSHHSFFDQVFSLSLPLFRFPLFTSVPLPLSYFLTLSDSVSPSPPSSSIPFSILLQNGSHQRPSLSVVFPLDLQASQSSEHNCVH
jgi:hypothetical protein